MKNNLKFLMLIGKSVSTGEPVFEIVGLDGSKIKHIAPAIFEYANKKMQLLKIQFFNNDVVYAKDKMSKFTIFKHIKNDK